MEENPTRVCELIVGSGDVEVMSSMTSTSDFAQDPAIANARRTERPTAHHEALLAGCSSPVMRSGVAGAQ